MCVCAILSVQRALAVSRTAKGGGCFTMAAATKRKTTTSTEVKSRWMKANYKRYQVQLRVDDDAELIEFIDQNKGRYGTTELFRMGIEKLKLEGLS